MARTADVVIMMLDATKGEVQRSVVGRDRLARPGKPWGAWRDDGCSSCVPELLVAGPGHLALLHMRAGQGGPQRPPVWVASSRGLCVEAGVVPCQLGAPSAAQNPPGAQPQAAEPCSRPDRLRAHQPVSPWAGQGVQGSSSLSLVAGSDVWELVVWGGRLVFVQVWGGRLTVMWRQCSLPRIPVKAVGLHQVSAGEGAGVGGHPPQQAQA